MDTLTELHGKKRLKRKTTLLAGKQANEMYIRLEDGRLVPFLRGGMVEMALEELGGRLVDVEPASKLIGMN
jgi:hypothetical protein